MQTFKYAFSVVSGHETGVCSNAAGAEATAPQPADERRQNRQPKPARRARSSPLPWGKAYAMLGMLALLSNPTIATVSRDRHAAWVEV